MATININVTNASAFTIGRRGENEVTSIIFDYSAWLAEFGPGTVTLLVKRNTDADPYPVVLSHGEDNTAIWLVTSTDTAYIGNGQAEFSYLVDSQIKKSIVYRITVLPDIIGTPSPEPPDPYETWIDTLLNLAGETQQNAEAAAGSATAAETAQGKAEDAQEAAETAQGKAEDAQEAAETAQGKAEDAQEAAETAQGKAEAAQTAAETAEDNAKAAAAAAAQARTGAQIARAGAEAARDAILNLTADATIDANVGTPEVEVTVSTEDDHKVLDFAFKNLKGETGAQGETGPQGPAATVTVGTTTTGAAGSQANVTNSGTSSAAVLNFTIPKGDKGATGETGASGADGITPTVTVTSITGGHNVAFDYGSGDPRNTDFDVMDGEVSAADLQTAADAKAPVIIDHAEGAIASFTDGAGGMPLKSCVINIEPVQAGSGDPSPNNSRPISGWTEANVWGSGINVWDEEWERGIYDASGNKDYNNAYIRSKNYIAVRPNASYYFLAPTTTGRVCYYTLNKTFISRSNAFGKTTFTTPNNCYFITFFTSYDQEINYSNDISINYPSTETSYHAYSSAAKTITWQDEAGTVYGGNLAIHEDGSGTLTGSKASADLGNATYVKAVSQDNTNIFTTAYFAGKAKGVTNIIAENLQTTSVTSWNATKPDCSICGSATSTTVVIRYDAYTTKEALKTALTGVKAVYELATPLTYNLTATQVGIIKTLYGINNIWADTGDVSVDYCADTKLFIEKLTMPTEDDMVANSAITSGQYFMIGNSLYLALANIASGAQITVGTNAQRVSLADALNAINS